jgi:hypothetical protein
MCPLQPEVLPIRFCLSWNQLRRYKNRAIRSENWPNRPINRSGMRGRIGWLIDFFHLPIFCKNCPISGKIHPEITTPIFRKNRPNFGIPGFHCSSVIFGTFWSNFTDFFFEFSKNWQNWWGPIFLLPPNFQTLIARHRAHVCWATDCYVFAHHWAQC